MMESTKAAISAEFAKMANAVDLRTFRALNRTCVCRARVLCAYVRYMFVLSHYCTSAHVQPHEYTDLLCMRDA